MSSLFSPQNSWCTAPATRSAVLVDADAYYRALHDSLIQAKKQVLLLGWDIDSRLCLRRDLDQPGRCDATLGRLLDQLARRGVDIHLLSWDFIPLYAFEREPLTAAELDWKTHKRMNFELDGVHPHGASHHQKVVVVDDAVAYAGGIDLCFVRWDTPDHILGDPRRVDPPHAPHEPFHDVQMVVEGPVAARLGDLCRERWRRATGEVLSPRAAVTKATKAKGPASSPWPRHVKPEFVDVAVAVARTEPDLDGRPAVHEVEQLHIDMIYAAKDHLYYENQYLTSHAVGTALQERLREANGPEVVIVVPSTCSGWLEEHTMGIRRSTFLRGLLEADVHHRSLVVAPRLSSAPGTPRLNVHGKVSIMDDHIVRVGSANLSNRSMGLDTECDLAIEAPFTADGVRRADVAAAIAGVRARLLGEHLDEDPAVVAASIKARGLKGTVAHLSGVKERTVVPVGPVETGVPEVLHPLTAFADPEQPAAFDPLLGRGLDGVTPPRRRLRAALTLAFAVVLCLGLAALWRFTPLAQLVSPEQLQQTLEPLAQGIAGPFIAVGVFVAGGLMFFPLTLLVLQSGLLFSAPVAILVSTCGAMSSALLSYGIGRALGANTLVRLIGKERLKAVQAVDGRGVLAIAALRLAPVAPFTLVNLAAGAARVRLPHFMLGSLIGMAPGILVLTLVGQGVLSLFRHRLPIPWIIVIVVSGLLATVLARTLVRRRRARHPRPAREVSSRVPVAAVG